MERPDKESECAGGADTASFRKTRPGTRPAERGAGSSSRRNVSLDFDVVEATELAGGKPCWEGRTGMRQ